MSTIYKRWLPHGEQGTGALVMGWKGIGQNSIWTAPFPGRVFPEICPSVPGEFLDERASQLRLREIWNDTKELSIVTQVQLFSSQTCFWRHEQDLETCCWSFDRNPHQFTIIKKLHFSSILYSIISVPINDNREHRVLESEREKRKNRTCRAKIQNSCYKLESSWQLCTADLLFCKDAKSCQSFHTEISQNWHVSICQK